MFSWKSSAWTVQNQSSTVIHFRKFLQQILLIESFFWSNYRLTVQSSDYILKWLHQVQKQPSTVTYFWKFPWPSGSCPSYSHIQLPFASELISNGSPHRHQHRITTHPKLSTIKDWLYCSHTLNSPHSSRFSWCHLLPTSWSPSPLLLHVSFMTTRVKIFDSSGESNQDFHRWS